MNDEIFYFTFQNVMIIPGVINVYGNVTVATLMCVTKPTVPVP